jgi:SAM-dependent methyltransferase
MKTPLIYDCFPFFNETDLLKVRMEYLRPLVGRTYALEATVDHSGKPHPPILEQSLRNNENGLSTASNGWLVPLLVEDMPTGTNNWERVWHHRNALVTHPNFAFLKPDALVLFGDIDEIPTLEALTMAAEYFTSDKHGIQLHGGCIVAFEHQMFYYNTQTVSPNPWRGCVLTTADTMRRLSPQCVRYHTPTVTLQNAGWHFSYFGGVAAMQQKMQAIAESPWSGQAGFIDAKRIETVIASGKDLYGRESETWIRLPKPPEGLPPGMERFAGTESRSHYSLQTAHPVASNSLDHLYPVGATRDNTHYPPFAKKMASWLSERTRGKLCMDIGCAGGGLVVDYLAAGLHAIGIEGTDKAREAGHGHWPILDGVHLFTADITKPFRLRTWQNKCHAVLITAFEVLEHIAEEDLPGFIANIKEHLSGWFVCTINSDPWPHLTESGKVVDHHVTQRSPDWWKAFFEGQGFVRDHELEAYIGKDWPRIGHAHFAMKRVEEGRESAGSPIAAVESAQGEGEMPSRPLAGPLVSLSSTPAIDAQIVWYGSDYKDREAFIERMYDNAACRIGCFQYQNAPEDNHGFLSPSNGLYRKGDAPFVLLLNSDVELKPGWDVPLLAAMLLDDNLGAVGYSGGLLTEEATFAGHGEGSRIDYVEGWCLLLRREAVEAVALSNGLPAGTLFDDRNLDFAYCEDTDLCLRLKEAGWGLITLPNPDGKFAVHRGSETTKKVMERNGPDAERLRRSFGANHEYMRRRWASYLKTGRVLARQ